MKFVNRAILAGALLCASFAPAYPAAMSDYLENKLIDALFRAQTFTMPATMYVALSTGSAPTDAACGTEVSGGSYARVAVTAALTAWASTQSVSPTPNNSVSSGTGGTTFNSATITFPTPSAGWGTVTGMCVYDASSAGNYLWYSALTTSKTINSGDVVDFPVASLTFQIDN